MFVIIDGKREDCFVGWYVIHDGKNVKEVIPESTLTFRKELEKRKKKRSEYKKKTGFETSAEYRAYQKGLKDGKGLRS